VDITSVKQLLVPFKQLHHSLKIQQKAIGSKFEKKRGGGARVTPERFFNFSALNFQWNFYFLTI